MLAGAVLFTRVQAGVPTYVLGVKQWAGFVEWASYETFVNRCRKEPGNSYAFGVKDPGHTQILT